MQKSKDYSIHVGEKYEFLTIIGITDSKFYYLKNGNRKERKRFKVQCECGQIKEIDCGNILQGNTVSCGCHKKRILPHIHKLTKKISDAPERKEYRNYLYGAKKRDLEFKLSYKDFLNLSFKECVYCGTISSKNVKNETGSKTALMNGIDRIDSSKGYTIDNCAPCCSKCNYMKGKLSVKDFVDQIINIIHYIGQSDFVKELYPNDRGRG